MENCAFCRIIANQESSKLIYEDSNLIAFHDINPVSSVHFLILPKKHITTLSDCTEDHVHLLGKMMLLASKLSENQGCSYHLCMDKFPSGGYKVICNVGPNGGQEIYHLHIHVISGDLRGYETTGNIVESKNLS